MKGKWLTVDGILFDFNKKVDLLIKLVDAKKTTVAINNSQIRNLGDANEAHLLEIQRAEKVATKISDILCT